MPSKGKSSQATKDNTAKKNKATKTNENCLICKKKVDLATDGTKCNVCGSHVHGHCIGLSDECLSSYLYIYKENGLIAHRCQSCREVLGSMNDKIEKNTVAISKLSEKVDAQDAKQTGFEAELKELKEKMKVIEGDVKTNKQQSSSGAVQIFHKEMSEQKARGTNLIFHGIPDENSEDELKKIVQDILTYLKFQGEIKRIRRLASWRTNKKSSRPTMVVFNSIRDRDQVLDSARLLSKSNNPSWKLVRIVPDLTPSQRDAEEKLRKECLHNNLHRSQEDIENNMVFKLVGMKGSQQLKKFALRDTETLHKGRVVPKEVVNRIKDKSEVEEMDIAAAPHSTPKKGRKEGDAGHVKQLTKQFESRRPSISRVNRKSDNSALEGPSGEGAKRKLDVLDISPGHSSSPPLKDMKTANSASENEETPLVGGDHGQISQNLLAQM